MKQALTNSAAPVPRTSGLAEVADVEQADTLADGLVLGEDTPAGVLQRHVPAAELGELGAEGDVTVVQGRMQQVHGLNLGDGRTGAAWQP